MSQSELLSLIRNIETQSQIFKDEIKYIQGQIQEQKAEEVEALKRVDAAKQLPMLISTVSELLPDYIDKETGEKLNAAIIRTSARQEVFCPSLGLLANDKNLKPNSIIAINRDTFLIYQHLSNVYDSRVQKMLITEAPKDNFSELGGIDNIISQVKESILLPMQKPELFTKIGIRPSRNIILYSTPGLGKTKIARCVANEANAIFLSVCATELIQMYLGEGSALLNDLFKLASEKLDQYEEQRKTMTQKELEFSNLPKYAIIYIDEIDAIGTRRSNDDQKSNREIGRTLMTLLNLLDGNGTDPRIKIIASTNRIESLDPALIRSNRFDKKIQIQSPDLQGRCAILKIHSKNIKIDDTVKFEEIAHITEGFSGAQLRAVCVEAAMICMRRKGQQVNIQDYMKAVQVVSNTDDEEKAKEQNII